MRLGSRRGSWQIVQGLTVSMLPQLGQGMIFCAASLRAAASGWSRSSRRLMRASAALRAERCPSPGSRASSAISRSISAPDDFLLMWARLAAAGPLFLRAPCGQARSSEQLQARRKGQTTGDFTHLGLHGRFGLGLGVLEGGEDQVLEHFGFLGFDEARIDFDRKGIELAIELDLHEARARLAFHLEASEVLLYLLHAALDLLGLLHHLHQIHGPFPCRCIAPFALALAEASLLALARSPPRRERTQMRPAPPTPPQAACEAHHHIGSKARHREAERAEPGSKFRSGLRRRLGAGSMPRDCAPPPVAALSRPRPSGRGATHAACEPRSRARSLHR